MPIITDILNEAQKLEIRKVRDAYDKLPWYKKLWLHLWSWSLARALANLDPNYTTYSDIREILRLSREAWFLTLAFGVLQGFKEVASDILLTLSTLSPLTHGPRRNIFSFLSSDENSTVDVATSRNFLHPHDRGRRLGDALLRHTIKGNQDTVVAMLKRYPELLLYRGNVVDYSGREFKQVTALELATWALDVRHMAPAMLDCLTDNEDGKDYRRELVLELQSQFNNVVKEGGGVNYTIGCGLLKISQDPSVASPNETPEQRGERLNNLSRLLNRYNGLIQYNYRMFYLHNHQSPKELVEITDSNAIKVLQDMMNKKGRNLEEGKLQITHLEDELNTISEYVPNSRHIFKENHYHFDFLIKSLGDYVHSFDAGNTWRVQQRDAHWCRVVGLAQYFIPAHVAHHYCNPDESFAPTVTVTYTPPTPPTFKERTLKRVLDFYSGVTGRREAWWLPRGGVASVFLGLDFAIYRGWFPGVGSALTDWLVPQRVSAHGAIAHDCVGGACHTAAIDLAAITALFKVRTSELDELRQQLDSLQKPDAEAEPARSMQ